MEATDCMRTQMRMTRSPKGSALAEAAVSLFIIVPVIIAGMLLLSSSGQALDYRLKVTLAAAEGARYATQSSEWLGLPRQGWNDKMVVDVVNTSLRKMGLPDGQVIVKRETVGGTRFCTVSVSISGPRFLGLGSVPLISDTVSVPYSVNSAPATLGLEFDAGKFAVLPCYGHYSRTDFKGPSATGELIDSTFYYYGKLEKGVLAPIGQLKGKGESP